MTEWMTRGAAILMCGAAFAGCAETDTDDSSTQDESSVSNASEEPKAEKKKSCGTKATDDCTPRVGPNGSVRVDALTWKVRSAKTASTIGNEFSKEQADGRYVIVKLSVTSAKDESVQLTDSIVKLRTGGTTYDADLDGTVASSLSGGDGGDEPFFLESLGPDSTTRGTVVFDVPEPGSTDRAVR